MKLPKDPKVWCICATTAGESIKVLPLFFDFRIPFKFSWLVIFSLFSSSFFSLILWSNDPFIVYWCSCWFIFFTNPTLRLACNFPIASLFLSSSSGSPMIYYLTGLTVSLFFSFNFDTFIIAGEMANFGGRSVFLEPSGEVTTGNKI